MARQPADAGAGAHDRPVRPRLPREVGKRITGAREERVGIELGNDLTRVLPTELVQLSHPVLARRFYKAFTERSLVQHEMAGTEEAGKGPMVLLRDISGSMSLPRDENNQPTRGRMLSATAICVGLMSLAQRDRRAIAVCDYENELCGRWEFPPRTPPDLAAITDIASVAPRGGTDITKAMEWAEQFIARQPDFKRADVVLLYDGSDTYGPEDEAIRDRLRQAGVRIWGVTLECGATAYHTQMCEEVVSIFDLSNPNPGTDRLVEVVAA